MPPKSSNLQAYVNMDALPNVPAISLYREAWLTEIARQMEPFFRGWQLGPYRVTCGWPSHNGLGKKKRVVGQCFAGSNSESGHHELFISPLLDNPLEVAGTLAHEMAHVAAGVEAGHTGTFVKVCKGVGLTKGKPVVAMPNNLLEDQISKLLGKIGPYPHAKLKGVLKEAKPRKNTRVKILCPSCTFTCHTSTKQWASISAPLTCGCGCLMSVEEQEEEGERE